MEYNAPSPHLGYNNIAPFVPVIFAVCDKLSGEHDAILTADVVVQQDTCSKEHRVCPMPRSLIS